MLTGVGISSDYYYWWIEPGTDWTGGGGKSQTAFLVSDHPGLRIVYMNAEATVASLFELSKDDRMWLVEVAGTENYFDLAHSTGLIP